MVVLATEIDAGLFERPANGVWRTRLWGVGKGFAIRAVAHAPVEGKAAVDFEWHPHEPSQEVLQRLDRQKVEEVYRTLEMRLFIYYHLAYGFTPEGVECPL